MSKYPMQDVPGDAIASARAVTQYWYDVGLDIGRLDKYRVQEGHDAPVLTELRIRCDPSDDQGVLVVVKGYTEKGYVVAFHRGETVVEALVGAARRVSNHTLKWREDEYAGNK